MSRKKLSYIAIILAFVMIVSTNIPTFAENIETGDDAAALRQDTFEPVVIVNPLYADIVNPEDIEVVQYSEKPLRGSSKKLMRSSGEEIPATLEEFAEAYRQAFDETLGEWGPQFTVQYKVLSDEEFSPEQCNGIFDSLADAAQENQFIHNGNPNQGDYGLFQYAGLSYGGGLESGYDYETGKYYLIINFDTLLTYYTTPEQEAEETAMLSMVMDSLNLNTKTEYGKIKAIYDYICQHVTYDYANLNNDSYDLKYTSYAALMDGTAVCQGYATLFYRMALEAGLDARIITGYGGDGGAGGGGPHAWNIVRLKGLYYNVDCTWDAGRDPYDFFLKSQETFDLHARDAEYETGEFHSSYPMATADYEVIPEDLIEKEAISRTVTFHVENGSFDDGTAEDKRVILNGYKGDSLRLEEGQIPTAGTKPAENFKAGAWDTVPDTETDITEDVTYIYTYAQIISPSFKTCSVTLGAELGLNFYIDLPVTDSITYDGCYVAFSVKGTETGRVAFDVNGSKNEKGYYKFTANLNVLQMAEEVTAILHYKEGGEDKTLSDQRSIKDYVEAFEKAIEQNPDNQELKRAQEMVYSMADYGHYTHMYLAKTNNWTYGVKYAAMDKYFSNPYSNEQISEAVNAIKTEHVLGDLSLKEDITRLTISLTLDSRTAFNLHITPVVGYTGDVSAKVEGMKVQVRKMNDGRYQISVLDIDASKLGRELEFVITTENGDSTFKASPLYYANMALGNSVENVDEETRNAMVSIYRYFNAADHYVKGLE